jgi:BTB/POZ domain
VEHLRVLRRIADKLLDLNQRRRLLQDLTETYDFLQNKEAGAFLLRYKEEDLFLNVDNLDRLGYQLQWVAASKLIFNASDDTIFRGARDFLKRYEKLILQAGGKKIVRAQLIEVDKSEPSEILASWRENFNQMRLNGHFIDVTFVDSSGGEHDAHKIFLTCFGEYFTILFCNSGMKEAQDDTLPCEKVIRVTQDFDGDTIQSSLGKTTKPYQLVFKLSRFSLYWLT